jgi:hypothetical protein
MWWSLVGKKLRGGEGERESIGPVELHLLPCLITRVNRKINFDRNPKIFRLPFSKLKSAARRVSGFFYVISAAEAEKITKTAQELSSYPISPPFLPTTVSPHTTLPQPPFASQGPQLYSPLPTSAWPIHFPALRLTPENPTKPN